MSKTPHGKLRAEIKQYLESIGAWVFAVNTQGYGRKGIPDLMGIWRGRGFGVEVKVLPDKPTPWQERELAALTDAGGLAIVAYSLEDVRHIFQ